MVELQRNLNDWPNYENARKLIIRDFSETAIIGDAGYSLLNMRGRNCWADINFLPFLFDYIILPLGHITQSWSQRKNSDLLVLLDYGNILVKQGIFITQKHERHANDAADLDCYAKEFFRLETRSGPLEQQIYEVLGEFNRVYMPPKLSKMDLFGWVERVEEIFRKQNQVNALKLIENNEFFNSALIGGQNGFEMRAFSEEIISSILGRENIDLSHVQLLANGLASLQGNSNRLLYIYPALWEVGANPTKLLKKKTVNDSILFHPCVVSSMIRKILPSKVVARIEQHPDRYRLKEYYDIARKHKINDRIDQILQIIYEGGNFNWELKNRLQPGDICGSLKIVGDWIGARVNQIKSPERKLKDYAYKRAGVFGSLLKKADENGLLDKIIGPSDLNGFDLFDKDLRKVP